MAKVYTAGPLSADTESQKQAFRDRMRAAEAALKATGHEVVCPLDNGLHVDAKWEEHMRADIPLMLTCDTVALLDGWADSRGARIEYQLAKDLGLRVVPLVILLSQP